MEIFVTYRFQDPFRVVFAVDFGLEQAVVGGQHECHGHKVVLVFAKHGLCMIQIATETIFSTDLKRARKMIYLNC